MRAVERRLVGLMTLIPALGVGAGCAGEEDPPVDDRPAQVCSPSIPDPGSEASSWQPWAWDGWRRFPALYLAAEADGYMSAAQLNKLSRFSLVILEFRTGQWAEEEQGNGRWAGGESEAFSQEQCRRLRKAYPAGPPCLVYRSGMWAGTMYSTQRELLADASLFLDDTRTCEGFTDYPLDVVSEPPPDSGLDRCRWDFRLCDARDAYVGMVRQAAAEPDTAGVFFDNAQSVACDEARELSWLGEEGRDAYLEGSLETLARSFQVLVDAGKYPIVSTTNRFSDIGPQVPWESACPRPQEALVDALKGIPFARNNEFWMWDLGDTCVAQIHNTIREAELGIPTIVHAPYFASNGGCLDGCIGDDGSKVEFSKTQFLEFSMAAFLVAAGDGSYFGLSDMEADDEGGGWFDVAWDWFPQYDTIVTGRPLGPGEAVGGGRSFRRTFERGTVSVDCGTGQYAFELEP